ncbi:MAG: nucleoside kinase, partial [Spirochaetales bacterium]|nr:nucleoside kinase [Spirochaetales bacterium]
EEGEKNHIFPFQNQADAMYNSAHTYELSALAPYAQSLLRSVKPEAEQSYTTARRLLQFLELFYPISAEEIPSNSLVREFIGGSIYKTT